jgi:hypothetical protein
MCPGTRADTVDAALGQHFFVNYNGTLSPEWNFAQSQRSASAFVIAAKDKTLAAANATADVAWLQLHGVNGTLAKEIYRLYTRGGQPPASCTPGSAGISVKYTSQYCEYLRVIPISSLLTPALRALLKSVKLSQTLHRRLQHPLDYIALASSLWRTRCVGAERYNSSGL